jgi:hypothetical protein
MCTRSDSRRNEVGLGYYGVNNLSIQLRSSVYTDLVSWDTKLPFKAFLGMLLRSGKV